MSYLPGLPTTRPITRPITRPLPDIPTWRISGRYGTYFAYINVERYANTVLAYDAIQKVNGWLRQRHPYWIEGGKWLEGPFVQQVNTSPMLALNVA